MIQATLITAGQRHTEKIMEESSSKHLTAIAVVAGVVANQPFTN